MRLSRISYDNLIHCKNTVKNVHVFVPVFFSMLLLCSFFGLNELFQVKKDLTMSLLFFFLKMAKFGSERKREDGLSYKKDRRSVNRIIF